MLMFVNVRKLNPVLDASYHCDSFKNPETVVSVLKTVLSILFGLYSQYIKHVSSMQREGEKNNCYSVEKMCNCVVRRSKMQT